MRANKSLFIFKLFVMTSCAQSFLIQNAFKNFSTILLFMKINIEHNLLTDQRKEQMLITLNKKDHGSYFQNTYKYILLQDDEVVFVTPISFSSHVITFQKKSIDRCRNFVTKVSIKDHNFYVKVSFNA